MEVAEVKIAREIVQFVIFEVGIEMTRQRQRIQIRRIEGNSLPFCGLADKADVKISVMGNQQTVAYKIKEFGQNFGNQRRILNHIVGDRGQARNLLGNGHLRIDKGVEGIQHLAVLDKHGADFGNGTGAVGKTRGFDIKYH